MHARGGGADTNERCAVHTALGLASPRRAARVAVRDYALDGPGASDGPGVLGPASAVEPWLSSLSGLSGPVGACQGLSGPCRALSGALSG